MSALPHDFRDPALLDLALTHSSVESAANNERLEFLGDAVLDLIVAEELYRDHPEVREGEMTQLKAWVVSRRVLAVAGRRLELEDLAKMGPGMQKRALPRSVLANLFEAVLGAVYLDAGFEAAREFARVALADQLAQVRAGRPGPNPKQALQHRVQASTGVPPRYELLEQRGDAHSRAFLVAAQIDGQLFPSAWGRTLKEAERWAAHEALIALDSEEDDAA